MANIEIFIPAGSNAEKVFNKYMQEKREFREAVESGKLTEHLKNKQKMEIEQVEVEKKLKVLDRITDLIKETITSDELPILIGHLNKPQGIKGFEKCEIGHPVFEYQGKYLLYMKSESNVSHPVYNNKLRQWETVFERILIQVPYNKESFSKVVDFITYKTSEI